MKANFITESILYWLARGLSVTASRIPPWLNVALGARMGDLAFLLLPKRRLAALKNLRAAFGHQYTPAQYRRIVRRLFENLGMIVMEIARIPWIDRAYVERWIAIAPHSREHLEAALAKGRGVVLITGHFGNWELTPIAGALLGYPTLVLARQQGWPRLNRLLTEYRQSKGCRVVTKGFPIRELIRGLREGRVVGIVSDQDGGKNGVLAPFLGHLASTAPGAIALGLETEAPILPIFLTRTKGPHQTLTIEEPIQISPEGSLEERVKEGLTQYLQALERVVRRNPEQWFWLHRRWKSSPQRRLLILSDGKPGHLSQSKAFSHQVKQAWESRMQADRRLNGAAQDLVKEQVVEISFRHPLWRWLIAMMASLAPRRFAGGDGWLKWGLTSSCYQALCSEYADLSVSCGASTSAVNLLWAWGVGAKAVHITRSVFPSWRRFDLAVIPGHDRPPVGRPNLLVMDGALTGPFSPDPAEVEEWRKRLQIARPRQIGLMLGGPTRGISFGSQPVERLILGLLESCEVLDAELLVTSSRRTPASIEATLEHLLKRHPRCRLLTLAGRSDSDRLKSVSEAVPCILGLADTLVVSGDSISMVSEAISTRKPVIGFMPAPGRGGLKYQRFLNDMELRGKIHWVEPEEVGPAVIQAIQGKGALPQGEGPFASGTDDPVVEYLRKWL